MRSLLGAVAAVLVLPAIAAAKVFPDMWVLDPLGRTTGPPFTGEQTFTLHFQSGTPGPADRLQFGLGGTFEIVSMTLAAGITNNGTLLDPDLVFDGTCTGSTAMIAQVVVRDSVGAGGTLCLVPHRGGPGPVGTGRVCFTCSAHGSYWIAIPSSGYVTTGQSRCTYIVSGPDCYVYTSVETTGWGRLKALYR